jgi:hypothetical protein
LSDDRNSLRLRRKRQLLSIAQPFEHIFALLNGCSANFKYLCDNDIFVFATKNYLASLDNPESGKALNLLGVWTDTWPDASEELADGLDEAVQSIKFILAATAGGRND